MIQHPMMVIGVRLSLTSDRVSGGYYLDGQVGPLIKVSPSFRATAWEGGARHTAGVKSDGVCIFDQQFLCFAFLTHYLEGIHL